MKQKKNKPKSNKSKLRLSLKVPRERISRQIERLKPGADKTDEKLAVAIQNLPRITNETVAEHREEVLSSARKYIYPLSHSKRRIVVITSVLLVLLLAVFFTYCVLALYRFKSTSTFIYGVTQVLPLPVAKVGGSWVSYESYLFELRHSMHYYQTQQQSNFNTAPGKRQLAKLEQDSLNQVVEDAYVKQLAAEHHVSVSAADVNNEVNLLRAQNRLGSSDEVFRNVLSEYWGWTVNDFKRELKSQLLAQAVVAKLDTDTQARAAAIIKQLNSGADFGELARQVSDDSSTKANGGNYGIAITRDNQSIPVQVARELFRLKAGQYTGVINTGGALEIDKVIDTSGDSLHAARIVLTFKPLSTYLKSVQAQEAPRYFIKID